MNRFQFFGLSVLFVNIITLQVISLGKKNDDAGASRAACAAVVAKLVFEHQLTSRGLELGTNYCLGTSAVHFVAESSTNPADSKFNQPCKWMRDCGPNLVCVQSTQPGEGVCRYGTMPITNSPRGE